MKRSLGLVVGVVVLLLALTVPVAAHELDVAPKGQGGGTGHWVGGGPLNAQGAALVPSPIGLLPPSHMSGLPHACNATNANPSAVTFTAPPFDFPGDDTCQHGVQPAP